MYAITDDFGTFQITWTYKAAMEWFRIAGDNAAITNIFTLKTVAFR